MKLLNLPAETFKEIMEMTVIVSTLDKVVMFRLVCKKFDIEIIRAICSTKALESDAPYPKIRLRGYHLLKEYLVARTVADRTCIHHFSQTLRDTIDYVVRERPQDEARRHEYMVALCEATMQSHSDSGKSQDTYNLLNAAVLPRANDWWRRPLRIERSVLDNALAAAIHLPIPTLLPKLVENNIELQNTYFGYPLRLAARRGDIDLTRLLLNKQKNFVRQVILDAMHEAASNGHLLVLQLLYNVYHRRARGKYSRNTDFLVQKRTISHAANGGSLKTVRFLVQQASLSGILKHCKIKTRSMARRGVLPWETQIYNEILSKAAKNGFEEMAQVAINDGANPNPVGIIPYDHNSHNPLKLAAENGREGMVRLLLENGAKVDCQSTECPALYYAVKYGWLRVAQILIDSGADVNARANGDQENESPLRVAARRGHVDCVRLLLESGANIKSNLGPGELSVGEQAWSDAELEGNISVLCVLAEYGVKGRVDL